MITAWDLLTMYAFIGFAFYCGICHYLSREDS